MIEEIRKIAYLQTQYSSGNTPEMKLRGELIRQTLPSRIRGHWDKFKKSIEKFFNDLSIEGSDGKGLKTQAPWVRLYSKDLSPSATSGFYVVIFFSTDGTRCFVTLGFGANKWVSERGDLIQIPDSELKKKAAWAKDVLSKAGSDYSNFSDPIIIGSKDAVPKSFEKSTVLCKQHLISTITEEGLIESISKALQYLAVIYDRCSYMGDLSESEISGLNIEAAVNPSKVISRSKQGYGLTPAERKAVELRAMELTHNYLLSNGFKVKDASSNNPFDLLATKEGKILQVEVKGSTSSIVDSILMTSNEVKLHEENPEMAALSIVFGIRLVARGKEAKCEGGEIEFIHPWEIAGWERSPKAFLVVRPHR